MAFYDNAPELDQAYNQYALPTQQQQPGMPSFLNAFQAGMQQRKQGQSPLLAGLAGQSGRGGILGGIGKFASFLA